MYSLGGTTLDMAPEKKYVNIFVIQLLEMLNTDKNYIKSLPAQGRKALLSKRYNKSIKIRKRNIKYFK